MTFCDLTIYNDNPPPIRLYTKQWSYYRTRFFTEFATGLACRQGTLTPRDTWFRPIYNLHMFCLLRPILFPSLSLFFRTIHLNHLFVICRFCHGYIILKVDWINNMGNMCIPFIEPSSVILSQIKYSQCWNVKQFVLLCNCYSVLLIYLA